MKKLLVLALLFVLIAGVLADSTTLSPDEDDRPKLKTDDMHITSRKGCAKGYAITTTSRGRCIKIQLVEGT